MTLDCADGGELEILYGGLIILSVLAKMFGRIVKADLLGGLIDKLWLQLLKKISEARRAISHRP